MDLNPYKPPAEAVDKATKPRSLFVFIFLDLWEHLLKSRNAIICDLYLRGSSVVGIRANPTEEATEARHRWLENQTSGFEPTTDALYKFENNFVIATRLLALWMVFWTNLLPVIFAGWWLKSWMDSAVTLTVAFTVRALICVIPIYIVSVIVSLYLHVVFAYPILRLVSWLYPTSLVPPLQPRTDSATNSQ